MGRTIKFRGYFFGGFVFCFSGGLTLSTSAITSLNGSGICGIGLELVIFFSVVTMIVA